MNELKKYSYLVTSPANCKESEVNRFYDLVLKGGKVQKVGLKKRIQNCSLLGFCYREDEVVGVSAIKIPLEEYKLRIIEKSKIGRNSHELNYEVGYSYTEIKHRKKGINRKIKIELLKHINYKSGILFSTTAIKSSQNFLTQNGFLSQGVAYDGVNDKKIRYYEKNLNKLNTNI